MVKCLRPLSESVGRRTAYVSAVIWSAVVWGFRSQNAQVTLALATFALAIATVDFAYTARRQFRAGLTPSIRVSFSALYFESRESDAKSPRLKARPGEFGVILENFGPVEIRDVSIVPFYYSVAPGLALDARFASPSYVRISIAAVPAETTTDRLLDLSGDLKTLASRHRISPAIVCVAVEFGHEVTRLRTRNIECVVHSEGGMYLPLGPGEGATGPVDYWRRVKELVREIREFERDSRYPGRGFGATADNAA